MGIPHLPTTATPYLENLDIPLDNDGKKTLTYAVFEANGDKEYWLDTDHLLRGLARFENLASEAMREAELTLSRLRAKSREDRTVNPSPPRPEWARFNLFRARLGMYGLDYPAFWMIFGLAVLAVLIVKLLG